MNIRELLENVKNNTIDIDGALDKLKNLPYEDIGYPLFLSLMFFAPIFFSRSSLTFMKL